MRLAILASAIVLTAAGAALAASAHWRDDAKPDDVQRIARLDQAWDAALKEARADGYGGDVQALGALADPKAALAKPQPTPGTYRCRTIKLGTQEGTLSYVAYGWFKCQVALSPGGDLTLDKITGSQRQYGNLYPDASRRLVFLGAGAWGDEKGRATYGRDRERDAVGVFERIGPNQYRLVMPWPRLESKLDILELRR